MSEVCSGEQTFVQLRTGLTLIAEPYQLLGHVCHGHWLLILPHPPILPPPSFFPKFSSAHRLFDDVTVVYLQMLLADRAEQIIRSHDQEKPLFLYLPFQSVHTPLEVT